MHIGQDYTKARVESITCMLHFHIPSFLHRLLFILKKSLGPKTSVRINLPPLYVIEQRVQSHTPNFLCTLLMSRLLLPLDIVTHKMSREAYGPPQAEG